MMGSADALPEEPAVRPMFVEDMTEEQLASAVSRPALAHGSMFGGVPVLDCNSVLTCDFPCPVSSPDGVAVRTDKPGQHLLHERHRAVSPLRA